MLGFLKINRCGSFLWIFLSIVSILVLAPLNAFAQSKKSEQSYEKSIGEIGSKIKSISQTLNANKELLKSERDELFKIEQTIADLDKKLESTNYELAKNEHELGALKTQITALHKAQEENKETLARLISARYKNGKPDYLKSVLNQKNPYAVGRLNNYHNYFSSALKEKYSELNLLANEAITLEASQTAVVERLEKDKAAQIKLKEQQHASKKQRAFAIAKLDTKVASDAQRLDKLKKDRGRLRSLLSELKKQAAELERLAELKRIEEQKAKARAEELAKKNKEKKPDTSKPTPKKPTIRKLVKGGFAKQKGRLNFPVAGSAKRKFGSRLPESGMRAEGHFFDTKNSVSVKSIFRGRVLFADFLKGYGQLIIVDHGDDHISLYGHNEKILKRVGDMVETGEVIAKSGVTGGLKSPGLYFEIRNNATPVDPARWCQ